MKAQKQFLRAAAVLVAALALSACADDKLAANPPPGVDFSGQWKLDEADSDDPQHLAQAANGTAANSNNTQQTSGRGRGRGGAGGMPGGGYQGPVAPAMSLMGASLRWPGKALEIKQVAGVVAFTSDGRNRVCQPGAQKKRRHRDDDPHDRDSMPSARDAPPPVCGWSEGTLVLHGADTDDGRPAYEEDYSLSDDRMRLVEVVRFTAGRSNGFTLSRVWDRVQK